MQAVYSVKMKFIDEAERKVHNFDLDWRAYDFGDAVNFVEGLCTEMCVVLTTRGLRDQNEESEPVFYDWIRGVENRRFSIMKHRGNEAVPAISVDIIRSNQIVYDEAIGMAMAYSESVRPAENVENN